jgi:hypothetical protein
MRVTVLLGVQLDDEMLFNGQINILSRGKSNNLCYHIGGVVFQPFGGLPKGISSTLALILSKFRLFFPYRNNHARFLAKSCGWRPSAR